MCSARELSLPRVSLILGWSGTGTGFKERDDSIPDRGGNLGFRHERQLLNDAAWVQDDDLVGLGSKAAAFFRDVVGHEQVESFARELGCCVVLEVGRLGGESDPNQSAQ